MSTAPQSRDDWARNDPSKLDWGNPGNDKKPIQDFFGWFSDKALGQLKLWLEDDDDIGEGAPLAAQFDIKVFADDGAVAVGDGWFKFWLPRDLNGKRIVDVAAYVTGDAPSADVVVSIWNNFEAADVLSVPITIQAATNTSYQAGTQPQIDTNYSRLTLQTELWINVDQDGTDATGLGVIITCA